MLKSILALSLIAASVPSFAASLVCGDTTVSVVEPASERDPYFRVMLKNKVIDKTYSYEIQKDYLHLRCDETSAGVTVLFFNHFCGGSGCADYGNFGIIEVKTGAILLEPDQSHDGNLQRAKEIMGKDIRHFSCSKESGEVCIHSKVELG